MSVSEKRNAQPFFPTLPVNLRSFSESMSVNAREKKSFYICVLYVYRLLYISLYLFSLMYSYKKVMLITLTP
nr:MAG TPA: hypothetical protein [Caudoviricetes sp.]